MGNKMGFPAFTRGEEQMNPASLQYIKFYNEHAEDADLNPVDIKKVHDLIWIKKELLTVDRNLSHIIFRLNLPEIYKVWELR